MPQLKINYGDGVGNIDLQEQLRRHVACGRLATVTGVDPTSRRGRSRKRAIDVAGTIFHADRGPVHQ